MSGVWYARLMNKDPEPPSAEYSSSQFNPNPPLPMLGNLHNQQPPQPQQQIQQQQQQQQPGQGMLQPQPMPPQQPQQGFGQQNGPIPPPPPLNGQDQQLSSILHFLQSEWRRYERDRNEWEVERAELRSRVALLEGERRSFENVKLDLMRRIKMLEYALKMERTKQLTQPSVQGKQDSKQLKEDNQSQKGSVSSSPRSEDIALPPEQRLSLPGLPTNNGIPPAGPSRKDPTGASWPAPSINGNLPIHLGKSLPGRDPKSRARSRDYLKQCLQEVNYLTSPAAMNPLPNRPLLSNPTMPAIPNVPSIDSLGYNGRPRKGVPEMGKDFPQLNGPMGFGAPGGSGQNLASASGSDSRPVETQGDRPGHLQPPAFPQAVPFAPPGGQHPLANAISPIDSGSDNGSIPEREGTQEGEKQGTGVPMPMPAPEPYRLDGPGFPPSDGRLVLKDTEEVATKVDESGALDDVVPEGASEGDSRKVWTVRRTLRSHLDAVRAIAFHPMELCLVTGGDDFTVKIWRMSPSDMASGSVASKANSDIEPQITYRGHTAPVTRLVISAAKGLIYSASLDATIHVWDIPPPLLPCYAPYDPARSRGVLVGHTDAVWDIALARDDTMLVSCGAEGIVKVWSLMEGGPGSLKLSWGYDGTEPGEVDRKEEIGATAIEPLKTDLRKVAVAYQNAIVKLFDLETGVSINTLRVDVGVGENPVSQVNRLASHPALPLLVTAHEDKSIRIFDIPTGQCTYSMLAHLDSVTSISIDRAGFSLVSGSHDCSIRFWDLINTRSCLQEIQNHREKAHEGVLDVEFHPALPFMASSGADGSVKLYTSESS